MNITSNAISERSKELAPTVASLLRQAWMPGDWFLLTDAVVSHYAVKAAVCSLVADMRPGRAVRVVEIGTRCGYSAAVFRLATPAARLLCFDGGTDPDSDACLRHARGLFAHNDIDAALIVVDCGDLAAIPAGDFAHVDGDHTYIGALRDLRLCGECPTILADDCDNPDVRRAVEKFVAETGRAVLWIADGLREAAVIQ